MIIVFKMLAVLLLIPMSILIFIFSNLCFKQFSYIKSPEQTASAKNLNHLFFKLIKWLMLGFYCLLWMFVSNVTIAIVIGIIIISLFIYREYQIKSEIKRRNLNNKIILAYCQFDFNQKFKCACWFSLTPFISLLSLIPSRLICKNVSVDVSQLIKELAQVSKGTKLELQHGNRSLNFEIL